MGNFSYENQGASTYLVYTLSDEEVMDSTSLRMITNNAISGFAGTMFMQMNAIRYIKYNVSSRIPVSQFFSGPVNKKRLLGVFDGIVSGMLAAEEYMIDTDTILMDLNYIYADVSTCDAVLVCLPVRGYGQPKPDLCTFFKEIMFRTQFDQMENCDHVTKIINCLNSVHMFSLADFKVLLQGLREGSSVGPAVSSYTGPAAQVEGYSGGGIGTPGGSYSGGGSGAFDGAYPGGGGPAVFDGTSYGVYSGGVPSAPGGGTGAFNGAGAPGGSYSGVAPSVPVPPMSSGVPGPGFQTPPVQQSDSGAEAGSKEKGMSLFYLLRHYDKENAGIYKAQKEEKKQQKAVKEQKKKGKVKKGTGFAIPGQMVPPISPAAPSSPIPPIPPIPGGLMSSAGAVSPQGPAPSVQQSAGGLGMPGVDFGNTVIMGGNEDDDGGATMIMGAGTNSAGPQIHPHLIRQRNNERIPIRQNLFRLGRNQDFNDYVVLGNEFVGNTHCHILIKGEEYFIVDDNSKNHTFVNGVMVMPGTEVKLMHGQTVTLADEEFEFRLF